MAPSAGNVTVLSEYRLVVDELERVDGGKMNPQLIANEENQDRAQWRGSRLANGRT